MQSVTLLQPPPSDTQQTAKNSHPRSGESDPPLNQPHKTQLSDTKIRPPVIDKETTPLAITPAFNLGPVSNTSGGLLDSERELLSSATSLGSSTVLACRPREETSQTAVPVCAVLHLSPASFLIPQNIIKKISKTCILCFPKAVFFLDN